MEKTKAKRRRKSAATHSRTLYMAVNHHQRLLRDEEQLPIFWLGKKASEFAKKIQGKKTRVTLSW